MKCLSSTSSPHIDWETMARNMVAVRAMTEPPLEAKVDDKAEEVVIEDDDEEEEHR